jgi:hypothetical protein
LREALKSRQLSPDVFITLKFGETRTISSSELPKDVVRRTEPVVGMIRDQVGLKKSDFYHRT